jgi:hypothetical protein
VAFRKDEGRRDRSVHQKITLASNKQPQRVPTMDLGCRLLELNSFLFPGVKSSFTDEINRVYDEHMSIIDSLKERLSQMRNH